MNIFSFSMIKLFIAGFIALQLAGCNADDYVVSSASNATHDKQPSNKYPGKPQAPVDIDFDVNGSFVVDQETPLSIVFTSSRAAEDLNVALYSREHELLLSGAQPQYAFGPQQAGQDNRIELGVTPRSEGLFYISINARLTVNGASSSKSFAIPVDTRSTSDRQQMKPARKAITDHKGQRLIIMPAVESDD